MRVHAQLRELSPDCIVIKPTIQTVVEPEQLSIQWGWGSRMSFIRNSLYTEVGDSFHISRESDLQKLVDKVVELLVDRSFVEISSDLSPQAISVVFQKIGSLLSTSDAHADVNLCGQNLIFRPRQISREVVNKDCEKSLYKNGMEEEFRKTYSYYRNATPIPTPFLQGTRTFMGGRIERGTFDEQRQLVLGSYQEHQWLEIRVEGGKPIFRGLLSLACRNGKEMYPKLVSNFQDVEKVFTDIADLLKSRRFVEMIFPTDEEAAVAYEESKELYQQHNFDRFVRGNDLSSFLIVPKLVSNENGKRVYANGTEETFSREVRWNDIGGGFWNHGKRIFPSGVQEEGWFSLSEDWSTGRLIFGSVTAADGTITKVKEISLYRERSLQIQGEGEWRQISSFEDLVAAFEKAHEELNSQYMTKINFSAVSRAGEVLEEMRLEGVLDRLGLIAEFNGGSLDLRPKLVSTTQHGTARTCVYANGLEECGMWLREVFVGIRTLPNGQIEEGQFRLDRTPILARIEFQGQVRFVGQHQQLATLSGPGFDGSIRIINWDGAFFPIYCSSGSVVENGLSDEFIFWANKKTTIVQMNDTSTSLMTTILYHSNFAQRRDQLIHYLTFPDDNHVSRYSELSDEAQKAIWSLPDAEKEYKF